MEARSKCNQQREKREEEEKRLEKSHELKKRVEWGSENLTEAGMGGRATKRMLPHQRAAGADPP